MRDPIQPNLPEELNQSRAREKRPDGV